jgi:N-methylhydantoinase A
VGALHYYQTAIGSDNLISMEIGGTSCDVVLMSKGKVDVVDQLEIGGYHVSVPSCEVHTIGAGGGTIARLSMTGLLLVGPQGAGARPGPACYGFGGEEPTVTDAQVVLGRLKSGPYAGGTIVIDGDLAERAVSVKIANPLGISCQEAAAGIIRLMEQKLLAAVQRLSIERGYDSREFTLVACGGAGPMHGAEVGRQLGCRQVYVPRISGAFCALGMLHVNARHDFVRTLVCSLDEANDTILHEIFEELTATAVSTLQREGFADGEIVLERSLSLHYPGQQSDIPVPIAGDGPLDKRAVRIGFERLHQQFFGHIQPEGKLAVTKVRLVAVGLLPTLPNPQEQLANGAAVPRESRKVWIDAEHGWHETPVYQGADLRPGMVVTGPAMIDEATTTILVGVGDVASIDSANNYLITLRSSPGKHE